MRGKHIKICSWSLINVRTHSRALVLKDLDRGINKTSTEGLLNPRSRDLQTLGRGLVNTSTEVFKYLGRGLKKTDLAHIQANGKFSVPCRGVNPAIPST